MTIRSYARMTIALVVFGNRVSLWIGAVLQIALILLLVYLLGSILRRRLKNAHQTETRIDDFVLDVVVRTKLWLIVVPVVYFGTRLLTLPRIANTAITNLTIVAAFAQLGIWLSGLVQFWFTGLRRGDDPHLATSVRTLLFIGKFVVWTAIVLLTLDGLGFNVTTLLAGLGIGGVAVALALQNVLGDLFASLSIVIDRPFVVGDVIAVDTIVGTVEQVGLKTTRIRSVSGEQVVIGNGDLLRSRLRNFHRMTERRQLFSFGVVYHTPAEKLRAIPPIVRGIIEGIEGTRFDRAHFKAFGLSSLDFEVVYWVLSPDLPVAMDVQQRVNFALVERFTTEGIEFAYPTQTLYVVGDRAQGSGVVPAQPVIEAEAGAATLARPTSEEASGSDAGWTPAGRY